MTTPSRCVALLMMAGVIGVSAMPLTLNADDSKYRWIPVPAGIPEELGFAPPQLVADGRPQAPRFDAADVGGRVLKVIGQPGPGQPDPPGFKKPTIHLIAMGFTMDKAIGKGVQANGTMLKDRMKETFLPMSRGVDVKMHWVGWETELTKRNIEEVVGKIAGEVKEQDAVLCYIATHGAYDPNRSVGGDAEQITHRLWHFFQLEDGSFIWRYDLRDKIYNGLKTKPALFVMLSDSCFNAPGARAEIQARAADSVVPAGATLASLLLNHMGEVDITASTRGQFSWYFNDVNPANRGGGIFTTAFSRLAAGRDYLMTWDQFFFRLRATTDQACQEQLSGVSQLPQTIIPLSHVRFQPRLELGLP